MSDTRALLTRITALRQRLEDGRAGDGASADRLTRLNSRVGRGHETHRALEESLQQLPAPTGNGTADSGAPTQLTARARRLLVNGRDHLAQLRALDAHFTAKGPGQQAEPLEVRYCETLAMLDAAMRTVLRFPESAVAQLRLCDGLEVVLDVVAERIGRLRAVVEEHVREAGRIHTLATLFVQLESGEAADVAPFVQVAGELLHEAEQGAPLHFLDPHPPGEGGPDRDWVAAVVARHSLTVAQVVARLVRHDADLRGQPVEPVVAALLHDVGMLRLPPSLLAQASPLSDAQRRAVEAHTHHGAELARRLLPSGAWLADAVANHHERLDGTGYPAGLREVQVAPLVRLLAVCDVYAAQCTARPYRPALAPRTALTDTLLLAERGGLDRHQAERLLQLSFYPVGSAVELSDGSIGVVIATHPHRHDLTTPSRPVVVLLIDPQGQALPSARCVDLLTSETRAVVRRLTPMERRQALGKRYPELA